MSVCLEYQPLYYNRSAELGSVRFKLFAGALLLAMLTLRVWIKLECTDLGYELAREQQRTIELDIERRELELQLSVLKRPDVLGARATQRLGLRPLQAQQLHRMVTR
jgi:hypothetical protein